MKLTVYRAVSVGVALLSLYTFVHNCVRVDYIPPLHLFWGLVHSAFGVAVFGAGVWWDRVWLRWGQLGLMTIVAFTTLNFNDNPWLGLLFLFVTVVVAYGYDIYDRRPVWKILGTVVLIFLGILVVYHEPVKSLLTFLGFGVASGVVAYILSDKVRRWRTAYIEAHAIARESLDLLKETTDEPRHG